MNALHVADYYDVWTRYIELYMRTKQFWRETGRCLELQASVCHCWQSTEYHCIL